MNCPKVTYFSGVVLSRFAASSWKSHWLLFFFETNLKASCSSIFLGAQRSPHSTCSSCLFKCFQPFLKSVSGHSLPPIANTVCLQKQSERVHLFSTPLQYIDRSSGPWVICGVMRNAMNTCERVRPAKARTPYDLGVCLRSSVEYWQADDDSNNIFRTIDVITPTVLSIMSKREVILLVLRFCFGWQKWPCLEAIIIPSYGLLGSAQYLRVAGKEQQWPDYI